MRRISIRDWRTGCLEGQWRPIKKKQTAEREETNRNEDCSHYFRALNKRGHKGKEKCKEY